MEGARDRHRVAIYSSADGGGPDVQWALHASGELTTGAAPAPAGFDELARWPPADAEPVDVVDLYPRLASEGYGYGPAFRGLVEAWRAGARLYGRVILPEEVEDDGGEHGLHPALFDAALHTLAASIRAKSPVQRIGLEQGKHLLPRVPVGLLGGREIDRAHLLQAREDQLPVAKHALGDLDRERGRLLILAPPPPTQIATFGST